MGALSVAVPKAPTEAEKSRAAIAAATAAPSAAACAAECLEGGCGGLLEFLCHGYVQVKK